MVAVVSLTEHIGATLSMQCRTFLASLLLGAAIGVFYDCFRILRKCRMRAIWAVALQDVGFFLCFTLANFFFMLRFTEGQIRWYLVAGECLGWTLYYFTVGELVMRVSDFIIRLITRIVALIAKLIGFLLRPVEKLLLLFIKQAKRLISYAKKPRKMKKHLDKSLDNIV